MSTRSGKTYKDPNKKRLNTSDSTLDMIITPTGKEIENNTNINMSCSRDLRTRKSKKNLLDSVAKVDKKKSTGSNWIVSDVSNNTKGSHTNAIQNSINIEMDNNIEQKPQVITEPLRKLKRKKSSIRNEITKEINNEIVKHINSEEENCVNYGHKDTENDLNSANKCKQLKKKKKKGTNSKKKKQKPKSADNYNLLNHNASLENVHIKALEDVDRNFLHSPNNYVRNRQSSSKRDSFEEHNGMNRKIQKHLAATNSSDNINHTEVANLNSSFSNNHRKRQSNLQNSSFKIDNNVIHIFGVDEQKEKKCISPINKSTSETLDSDISTGSVRSLIKQKANKDDDEKQCDISPFISRTSKNLKKNSCVGTSNLIENRQSDQYDNLKPKQAINTTYEKDDCFDSKSSIVHNEPLKSRKSNTKSDNDDLDISNATRKRTINRKSNINDITFEKQNLNATFDKSECITTPNAKEKKSKSKINMFSNDEISIDTSKVSTSFDAFKSGTKTRKSSINDATFDNNDSTIPSIKKTNENAYVKENILSSSATKQNSHNRKTSINNSASIKLDTTFDKPSQNKSATKDISLKLPVLSEQKLNTTFDRDIESSSKSSLISSDNSVQDIPRISITSDESEENIENTTPVFIESSMDETNSVEDNKEIILKPETPLKREGTFTKEVPEVSLQTPKKYDMDEIPKAGYTPFHVKKSSQKESRMNVTWSIEKEKSLETAPRLTRVMFCSPVDNPSTGIQEKPKIIKSNLKGSNKSFVFDENVSHPPRKRSYTHSETEGSLAKRSRRAPDQQQSVERLSKSRSRTVSANGKLMNTTPKKPTTPSKSKPPVSSRSRLPNFAALHQKEFDKMESLSDYKERKAIRARQMLTPSGAKDMLERISPKNDLETQKSISKEPTKLKDKTDTPTKLPTTESLKPGYTRFGFKMNLDFNPFSVPPKTDKLDEKPNRVPIKPLPSLKGATLTKKERPIAMRREEAKQAVMREKSFVEKRNLTRKENRTVIRGVRTNRRFELQMKFRNIDA